MYLTGYEIRVIKNKVFLIRAQIESDKRSTEKSLKKSNFMGHRQYSAKNP